ncbi:RDD family protein [Phycicoccus sp. Soil803]|uniref:RDD family protein n=1 Tax=Phycicoccus sp. Soil803 TaxID=1736415 RepID=UPI00070E97ED|nr:RDD family protein [Phycicoccus sp. Soil803]KRF24303.1 hypothetical protein ASG95_06930 [Phycicoccus sp. Soil803]
MSTPTTPGWYDDPEDDSQLRYFDGVVWSKHTTPRSTRPATGVAQPGQQQFPGQGHPPQYPGQGGTQAPSPSPVPGQAPAQPPATGGWSAPPTPQPGQQNPQFPGSPQGGWNAPTYGGVQRVATTPDGQPLASYWQRVGAFILDGIIQFVLMLVLGGWFLFKGFEPVWDELVTAMDSGDPGAFDRITADNVNFGYILAFGVIAAVITFGYAVFFLSRTGATPGKAAVGISVRLRDRPGVLSVGDAAKRTSLQAGLSLLGNIPLLGNLFSLVALVDLLWPAWDERRQALHDKLARTNVVVGKQPRG